MIMSEMVEVVVAISTDHKFDEVVRALKEKLNFITDERNMRPRLSVLAGKIPADKFDDLHYFNGVDLVQTFSLKLPAVDAD